MQKKGQKETGAYYTSDAITMFMSERVILPNLLNRIKDRFGIQFEHFLEIFADSNQSQIRRFCLCLFMKILPEFTILDNACGSGAFLLAALNVLVQVYAKVIYSLLGEPTLRQVIQDYLKDSGEDVKWFQWQFDGIESFLANPRWRFYIKRQVIIKNLYGVDIDKDAIDAAKSCLWFSMVSELGDNGEDSNAIPNNEYNLRCGNSLVGYVRLRRHGGFDQILPVTQVDHYLEELHANFPHIAAKLEHLAESRMLGKIIKIRGSLIQLFKKEHDPKKRRSLKTIIDALFEALHQELCDIHLHTLKKHWSEKKPLTRQSYLELVPFHWIAEFPEVVFNHGGFDVVLGNPPYITMKKQTKLQKGIYYLKYRTFHANGDMYYLFIERSFSLLNRCGTFSYIIPRYFLKAPTARTLRTFLAEQHLSRIYDFGQDTVFPGLGIHTLILFAHLLNDQVGFTGIYSRENFAQFQRNQLNPEPLNFNQADLEQEDWLFFPPAEQVIFRSVYQGATGQFSDFCVLSKGLQTGKDEVFVIDEEKRQRFQIEPEALVPFMKGSGIKRFFIQNDKILFLIFSTSHEGDAVMRLPNCAAYLAMNRPTLEDRTRVPEWYQWRLGDERITLKWKQPKIVTASRGSQNVFAIDRCGFYFSQDITFIQPFPENARYLYYFWAVLNSTITRLLMRWQFKELAEDVYEIFPEQIQKIPVKLPDDSTLEHINAVMREIERRAPNEQVEGFFREIDEIIYRIYTGQPILP